MAIDNSIPYPASDRLAAQQKAFYPLKIPVSHWQLRHYISHPQPNVLYYASGQDIYYLNTKSRKRKHIATLPFEARCTASGHGFVCVGGEVEGNFAIIKLRDERTPLATDTDGHLDALRAEIVIPQISRDFKVEKIGGQIVNSISIHKIFDEEAHLYDVVAVLTNNDCTARLYSLSLSVETNVLHLPDPMNHATLSPDGKTLVTVGDTNTCYFFERMMTEDAPQIPKPHNRLDMRATDWVQTAHYSLYVPDRSSQQGYFTTAWSTSGHLLAVGSEAGYITVFGIDSNSEGMTASSMARPLMTVPSSRPNLLAHCYPGAVRSMVFSPDPWDLLIWAEDQGRVCIGDLRTALRSKQVVNLEPTDATLQRYHIEEIVNPSRGGGAADVAELSIDEYIRSAHHDVAAPDLDGRRSRDDGSYSRILTAQDPEDLVDDPRGLTSDETQILDALRTTRQREEALNQGAPARTVNYTTRQNLDRWRSRVREFIEDAANGPSREDATRQRPSLPYLSRMVDQYVEAESLGVDLDDALLPPLTRQSNQLAALRDRRRSLRNRTGNEGGPQTISPQRPTNLPAHAQRAESNLLDSGQHEGSNSNSDNEDRSWEIWLEDMDLARGPLFEGAARNDRTTNTVHHAAGVRHDPPQDAQVAAPRRQRPSATATTTAQMLEARESDSHARNIAQQRERLRVLQRSLRETSALLSSGPDGNRQSLNLGPSGSAPAGRERLRNLREQLRESGYDTSRDSTTLRRYDDNGQATAQAIPDPPQRTTDRPRPPWTTSAGRAPTRLPVAAATASSNAAAAAAGGFEESLGLLQRRNGLRLAATTNAAAAASINTSAALDGTALPIYRAGIGFTDGSVTGMEVGVRTAGLAISDDGRTVWAATEEGLFEIGINVRERMRWPAVVMR